MNTRKVGAFVMFVVLCVVALMGAYYNTVPSTVEAADDVFSGKYALVHGTVAHVAPAHSNAVDMGASHAYPDACRTYYMWAPMGGIESIYGIACDSDVVRTHKQEDEIVVVSIPQVAEPIIVAPVEEPVVVEDPIVVVDPPVVVPDTDKPADTCGNGNPGNHKCVGNAGEDPNHKDTMDNDSTDGNGEHGNQGTNGNSDHANNKDK